MSDGAETPPAPAAELPPALLALDADADRERHFADHPTLVSVAVVERLCFEAARRTAARPAEAGRVVGTARWLAERLADDRARGLSLRAEANLRLYLREFRRALDRYRAALACFEAAGDELGAAITRSIALGSLNQLSEFELAERWAAAARPVFEARGDRLRLARLEFNLGQLYSRQDRFQEALRSYRWAGEQFRRHGEPRDVGMALRNLAVCHQDLNDFDAALAAYREAAAYCREHDLALLGLEVDYNIAYLHFMRGEYTRALRGFDDARRASREHDDPHHLALADLEQAEIYLELGLLREAEALAIDAERGFTALDMRYEVAKALTYRALAVARSGHHRQALELLEQAREILERQGNRPWVAVVDLDRAAILRGTGDAAAATRAARAALDGFAHEAIPTRMAACEILLARLAVDRADATAALELTASALDRLTSGGKPALEFQAHLVAGEAHESADDDAAAGAAYRRAERLLERLRGFLLTDEMKIAFTRDKRTLYEGLVRLTLAAGAGPEELTTAFSTIERAKSRALADLLAFRGAEPTSGDDQAVDEARRLRRELNLHYRQLDRDELAGGEEPAARRQRRSERIQRLELGLQRAVRRRRSNRPERPAAGEEPSVDLEAIQAALPAETLLIEYFEVGGAFLACLIGPDTLRVQPLGAAARVRRLQQGLRVQLGKFLLPEPLRERLADLDGARTRRILGELYGELLAPLRQALDWPRLLVVPHGTLHSLPFHALWDGERHLIDEYCLSYAPSATVYELCRSRPAAGGGDLVLGVPDERAPQILEEARAVAELLPDSRLFIGPAADRACLARHGRSCRVLHLATHGLFRSDNPMFSALQLGDGRLSLFDLYEMRLDAELAVLSGCGTGASAILGADELVGLTRGLLQAGARSLIASLWDVHDESTARLMQSFYGGLSASLDPAWQLRRAQQSLRDSYPHPYYWAPFVTIGGSEMAAAGSAGSR